MKFTLNYTAEEFKRIERLLISLGVDYDDISILRNFKKIANNIVDIIIIPDKNEISININPDKFAIPCIRTLKPIFGMVKNCCELIKDFTSDLRQDWGKFEISDLHLEPADTDKKETDDNVDKAKNLDEVNKVAITEKKTLEQIIKENKKD